MTSRLRPALSCCCFVSALACAGGSGATTETPASTSEAVAEAGAETAQPQGFGPWTATLSGEHPLVGTSWSTAEGRALERAELEAALVEARYVLLGETHDHPDHHRLQGEMIAALIEHAGAEAPGALVVAYEMLDPADQQTIDAYSGEVDGFAAAVDWANSGWPAWELYRPAFAPVLEAGVPILAAQFPRELSKRFMGEGLAVVEAETVARYTLDQPLPAELQSAWLDEMFASHCEMVPRDSLAPMVEIQRIRDARMADALLLGAKDEGRAVLVAGTGHTRAEGVPRLLAQAGVADAEVLTIGFVAVDSEREDPAAYGRDHDFIVFTPGIEREDPCAAMRGGGG